MLKNGKRRQEKSRHDERKRNESRKESDEKGTRQIVSWRGLALLNDRKLCWTHNVHRATLMPFIICSIFVNILFLGLLSQSPLF